MRQPVNQLRKELRQAGASAAEINELLPIASKLSSLNRTSIAPTKDNVQVSPLSKIFKPAAYVVPGLILGMFIVIMSQGALPTSALYPIQKFSDSVAIDIHSQYRATVMMKRARQVNELVARQAGSEQVLATLADYAKEANVYKSTPLANYAAFEYCKTNLQQAEVAAPQEVRQAISSTLRALGST